MVTAYPVVGKRKSFDICAAFMQGCKDKSQDAAVFYGIDKSNMGAWKNIRIKHKPYFYIDNSYFDETRGKYYRITRNAIQCRATGPSTGERLREIFMSEPEIKPWKPMIDGSGHILMCPQSDTFMEMTLSFHGNWLREAMMMCNQEWPASPVVLRAWSADKIALAKTLKQDLESAWMLVTHTSAAAVTAVVSGVHIHVNPLHALYEPSKDNPNFDRLSALRVLADNQWTLDEIREGKAWQWLNR